jgi:D-3-phosphoglycerate dehydrogenase
VDHIDVVAARNKGVWVCNVPDASIDEVATHALAMSLGLIRHLWLYDRAISDGRWDYAEVGRLHRPSSMTLGVVGLGRIGRRFVELASPVFSRILGHDPYLAANDWPRRAQFARLEEVFSQSDIISLHVPLTVETHHIVDAAMLARMRPGGYLVNTARGGLVDTGALLAALDGGHLAGAALDVLPEEPPATDDPVRRHPRIITTPHAAFYSTASEEELRRKSVMNVLSWLTEGRPKNVVVEGR